MLTHRLAQITDIARCPTSIRDGITDFLRFFLNSTRVYAPVADLLTAALQRTSSRRIVDLCSGGGGPWPTLLPALQKKGTQVELCLTDLFPNQSASEIVRNIDPNAARFHPDPVDATHVPAELSGFRTFFTSFHYFPPEQATAILADAVKQRQGIGAFEFNDRSPATVVSMLVGPMAMLVAAPFLKPFRWSRLFWTYLLPVIPFAILYDAWVTCVQTYTPAQLRRLADGLPAAGYHWEVARIHSNIFPLQITYLIGYPEEADGPARSSAEGREAAAVKK